MKEERPSIEELRSVIYIYADGSQYKMLDVQNYIDNLKSAGGLLATRSYIQMKPVNYEKITPTNPSPNS
jgi:hypothetical protein